MIKIFEKKFKARDSITDITNEDYNIYGLHKKEYFDTNGDLVKLEYYTEYDLSTKVFGGLAIKEDRVYLRSASTGLLDTRTTTITWFDVDGGEAEIKTNIVKYYSAKKGFTANKRARMNIIDKASMYLYQELMIANGGDTATTAIQVDDFGTLTDAAQSKYIKSNTQDLMDIIINSTDNTKPEYRSYITEAMKAALLSILDINYT